MHLWLDRIKKHALTHYTEDGWDILVECWEDAYILEHFRGCTTYEEAVTTISNILSYLSDYRYDFQNA